MTERDPDVRPRMDDGVPRCDEDDCPSFDGKRCSQTGFRPGEFCEPALREMLKGCGKLASFDSPGLRETLELRVGRLLRCLSASDSIVSVELSRMVLPLDYDPTPLRLALERLTACVDGVTELLGQEWGDD
jgi:hypothetical protein